MLNASRISYGDLFNYVEKAVIDKLGYSPDAAKISLSKDFINFFIDVCRPIIFGNPLGESHINSINNVWHNNTEYRSMMFFIMQQISIFIHDNDCNWDDVIRTAVRDIIIPKIDIGVEHRPDPELTTSLFLKHGWLMAAWVMQNTSYNKTISFLKAASKSGI